MYEKGKAIIFERPNKAVVKDIKFASVDNETLVVKVMYSGISSGTEMKVYQAFSGPLDGALWYPCVPGYEEVGEVVFVGKNAQKTAIGETLKVGDRVMANEVRFYPDYCAAWGGQAEYAIKNPKTSPASFDKCAKIPNNVSYQEAVVAYLSSVAKKGIDKVGVKKGEIVLVIGMGVIGLSAVQLAKIMGAKRVIAMDIRINRLRLAKKYTEYIVDSSKINYMEKLMDLTDGNMANVVIECSGNAESASQTYKYIKDGGWDEEDDCGRIHLQGDYPPMEQVILAPYQRWYTKNLRMSFTCATGPGKKEEILKLISSGKFDAKSLYTDEYFVDDAPKAYEDLKKHRYDKLKTLFKWL
jgi:2-desacetyl-2-hydroxyethyl bacteriochlorophyllide A dehydrogenase